MNSDTSLFPLIASRVTESRYLHPGFQFCGDPDNGLLQVPEDLLNYLLSLLKNDPILPPEVPLEQWTELLSVLNPHWILPLLHWQIGSLSSEFHPPAAVMEHIRHLFLCTRVQTFHLEEQLREVLAAFDKEGVRVLLLKGPALARTVYPDTALRQGSDIDLLVLPELMTHSRAILEGLGYINQEKRFEVSRDFYCEEKFMPGQELKNKRMIELHWDLHRFSGIKRDAGVANLFHNAVKIVSPPLTFEALHPIDALIHRSLNNAFIHDRDVRLSWIYDVVLLARSLAVPDDWDILQKRSMEWRARLAVEHALNLAQIWCGLQLPRAYKDFSTWPRPSKIETDAWRNATRRHERVSDYFKLHLTDSSGLSEKIRFFIHLLFPSQEYMKAKYPPSEEGLLFLSYIRRWGHWFRKILNR